MQKRSFLLALSLTAFGCSSGGESSSVSRDVATATTDGNGLATVTLPIPADANKVAVIAEAAGLISTTSITNDLGTTYLSDTGEITSLASDLEPFISTATVSSRDFDPPIAGTTLNVSNLVGSSADDESYGAPVPGQEVRYTLLSQHDADLNSGSLRVNVLFVGPTGSDQLLRSTMKRAYQVFRDIYAKAHITLDIAEKEVDGPYVLPDPFAGDELYQRLSSDARSPAVNICLGEDLSFPGLLGEAGGIPGSPLPSPRSCVGVSVINSAGPTGDFNTEFTRVLGETLAHEVGHYLGLFHPVEGDLATYDPLSDTPECGSTEDCDAQIGANFMYYTPIRDPNATELALLPQAGLTPQQAGVMNRSLAVD